MGFINGKRHDIAGNTNQGIPGHNYEKNPLYFQHYSNLSFSRTTIGPPESPLHIIPVSAVVLPYAQTWTLESNHQQALRIRHCVLRIFLETHSQLGTCKVASC